MFHLRYGWWNILNIMFVCIFFMSKRLLLQSKSLLTIRWYSGILETELEIRINGAWINIWSQIFFFITLDYIHQIIWFLPRFPSWSPSGIYLFQHFFRGVSCGSFQQYSRIIWKFLRNSSSILPWLNWILPRTYSGISPEIVSGKQMNLA